MTATRSFPHLGTQQSPIDLVDPTAGDLGVSITWKSLDVTTVTDGFTPPRKLAATPTPANGHLKMDGQRYVPVDVHWHFPSEHQLAGQGFKAEVHIVHIHKDDLYVTQRQPMALDWARIAVLGVFIKQGKAPYVPMDTINKKKKVTLDRADFIPDDSKAIRYAGSLTTPPYSENVTFIIFDTPMTATRAQLANRTPRNNRQLQDVNRRYCIHGDVKAR